MPPPFNDLIATLRKQRFYATCPCCGDEISLREAELFSGDDFTPEALEVYEQQLAEIRERKEKLKQLRSRGTSKSETGARSVNIGFILERLAPTLGGFRFDHNDCRSLFDPIDYVIFEGLSRKGKVEKVFFVDIKTGAARLSGKQREIRDLVTNGKVEFKNYAS